MAKKKVDPQKRAKPGSGKAHDKHAETTTPKDASERAEAGSGVKHDKHAPAEKAEESAEE